MGRHRRQFTPCVHRNRNRHRPHVTHANCLPDRAGFRHRKGRALPPFARCPTKTGLRLTGGTSPCSSAGPLPPSRVFCGLPTGSANTTRGRVTRLFTTGQVRDSRRLGRVPNTVLRAVATQVPPPRTLPSSLEQTFRSQAL